MVTSLETVVISFFFFPELTALAILPRRLGRDPPPLGAVCKARWKSAQRRLKCQLMAISRHPETSIFAGTRWLQQFHSLPVACENTSGAPPSVRHNCHGGGKSCNRYFFSSSLFFLFLVPLFRFSFSCSSSSSSFGWGLGIWCGFQGNGIRWLGTKSLLIFIYL